MSRMTLDETYYNLNNMLIYIKDNVPERSGFLDDIKKAIYSASESLWIATNNLHPNKCGIQLGEVYIIIPNNWKTNSSEQLSWQQCNQADIFITSNNENDYRNQPFTKTTGACGEPGQFIKIPQSYFIVENKENIKIKGKSIMKEIVKLRYGVFSEEPFRNRLTVYDGNKFIQSSCGANIKWKLSDSQAKCSKAFNNCKYSILPNANHDYSIMFDTETQSSKYFCNDESRPHNKMAESIHNIKCDQRSITNVILDHSDFKKFCLKNSTKFLPPLISIVKNLNRKIVFVLDVSGSMDQNINSLKRAVIEYINNVVESSAELGIAAFSSNAYTISPLLDMGKISNKEIIIKAVSGLALRSSTNIGSGLREALEILGGKNDLTPLFGTIFLFTDGQNNVETNTWNSKIIIKTLKYKGLVVNTIVYGLNVDNILNELSEKTGGKFVYTDPALSYTDLMNAFSYRSSCDLTTNSSIKVAEGKKSIELTNNDIIINLFYADIYIGKDLFLTMTFTRDISSYNVTLLDPSDREYINTSMVKENIGTTIGYKIIGNILSGNYKLKLKKKVVLSKYKRSTDTVAMSYQLSATLLENSGRTIKPTGEVSQSEIEQVNSTTIVTGTVDLSSSGIQDTETVTVILSMQFNNIIILEREIKDNGIGCDAISGDKIFTTCIYPNDFTNEGFYVLQSDIKIFDRNSKDPIHRTVDLGTIRVKDIVKNIVDKIPPSQIEYINLTIINIEQRILKLDFLATGDNGLIGNISRYEINVTSSKQYEILKDEEVIPLGKISFYLTLFNETTNKDPFIISIRGVDKAGNKGKWSPTFYFSWHYNEDLNKYSKLGLGLYSNFWIIISCLTLIMS